MFAEGPIEEQIAAYVQQGYTKSEIANLMRLDWEYVARVVNRL